MRAFAHQRSIWLVAVVFLVGLRLGNSEAFRSFAASIEPVYLPLVSAASAGTPVPVPSKSTSLMLGASDFAYKSDNIPIFPGTQPTVAQFHLPDGSKITQVTVYYSSTQTLTDTTDVLLQRQQFDRFETIAALSVLGSGPAGPQTQSFAVPAAMAQVDTAQYGYRIALGIKYRPVKIPGEFQAFVAYQVRVDYRLP